MNHPMMMNNKLKRKYINIKFKNVFKLSYINLNTAQLISSYLLYIASIIIDLCSLFLKLCEYN